MMLFHCCSSHDWGQCRMAEGEGCLWSPERSRLKPCLLGRSVCPATHFSPHRHGHLALLPDCPTSGHLSQPDPTCPRPKLLTLPSQTCPSPPCSVSDTGTTLLSASHTGSLVWISPSTVYMQPTSEFCQFHFLNISGLHCPQSSLHYPWPGFLPRIPSYSASIGSVRWELVNNAFLRCPSDPPYFSAPREFYFPFKANRELNAPRSLAHPPAGSGHLASCSNSLLASFLVALPTCTVTVLSLLISSYVPTGQ